MKAIVRDEYGSPDVLRLEEIDKPVPGDDEVLVKVHAASVNAGDWHVLRADPFFIRFMGFGLRTPKNRRLGSDFAGGVEAVGKNVTRFQQGAEVFGEVFGSGMGAFSEYVCVPENATLAVKAPGVSFEEAAAVPVAGFTALQALRDQGGIQAGQNVLVNGASGGVGTFAVQIAKSFEAMVTAVCSSRNLDTMRSIGADHVIDYTKEDFTRSGQRYDLIVAANGYHPIWDYRRALNPGGTYVMCGGSYRQLFEAMLLGPVLSLTGSRKMGNMLARANVSDLVFLQQLLEAGKVKSIIDRRYPLSEVPQAIRYLEEGHARGKVVITL